jgi:hypothetical protein
MVSTTRTTRRKPRQLTWILRIMIVGAATSVAAGLIGFTQRRQLEASYRDRIAAGLPIDPAQIPSVVQTTIVGGVVIACLLAAIWIYLAVLLQRQSRPVRWVTTVLCGINIVAAALWVISAHKYGLGDTPIASVVAQGISFVCALATVILLWTDRVRMWFAPETARESAEKLRLEGLSERESRIARIDRQQHQRAAARDLRRGRTTPRR